MPSLRGPISALDFIEVLAATAGTFFIITIDLWQ